MDTPPEKALQPEILEVEGEGDPVYETDQAALDQAWLEGDTVTPSGYLHRPLRDPS